MTVYDGQDLGRIRPFTGETAKDRITVMFMQVAKSIRDPYTLTVRSQIARGCPERDDWCMVQGIYWWVRNHIRYTSDIYGIDLYQSFRRSAELGTGDCDDMTIAIMSLLLCAGFRAGAKIISQDGKVYGHVYAVAQMPSGEPVDRNASERRLVPLDATVPSAVPGWEAPKDQRKLERIYWYGERGMS